MKTWPCPRLHSGSSVCGKGRHYSGYTVYLAYWCWCLSRRLDLDPWESEWLKFRSFNHRELDSADRSGSTLLMVCAIYSAGLYLYIHRITSAKRTHEVQPSLLVLVREGNMLLVMYSLDARIRYSTYSLIFKSQKGSAKALNFLGIAS